MNLRAMMAFWIVCFLPWETVNASVWINELVASNRRTLTDASGNTPDWIELYNDGSQAVDLNGWLLTDDPDTVDKWSFPEHAVLVPHGYLVVLASGETSDPVIDSQVDIHTNFALDEKGEYLALTDDQGHLVHEIAPRYPSLETDISYGLWQGELRHFSNPTPGKANEKVFDGFVEASLHSHERGFYEHPFDLRLFSRTPGAFIRFTLDGSEPSGQNGSLYDDSMPVHIATTTHVRSMAFKPGWRSSTISTHTYIFVEDVAHQPADPLGWPSDWGYSSDAKATVPGDYEMDPRVVNNTVPGYSVEEALLDIPTVSISMRLDDFISDATGIYANSQSRWERPCSVEYLLPDGTEGFQEDCKIEVHGNASRRPFRMQKHSLRLTFTSDYGVPKLKYSLFPDSDVEEFNQLVLRACFTDSWGLVSWSPSRYRPNDSQYLRDVWMKDSLRDMGQPSSHGNFVHLYVDGLYFGLHNLTERVGEDFFASHLGGKPEDWEVNEDLASPDARWRTMMSINPSTPSGYAHMQNYLDMENFADYMLLHLYGDAEDWPHHNGYAAANAISGDGRYRFFVWDQEIVLDYHGRAASRIDNNNGAGELFQKMRTSKEFRLLLADRVYKHCFHDGALSVTGSQDRYLALASGIDKAIVAESARWGDTQMSTPYGNAIQQPSPLDNVNHNQYPPVPFGPDYVSTREDNWILELDNIIQNYIPAIHDTTNSFALINLLRAKDLYPDMDPPSFQVNGADQHGGAAAAHDVLAVTNPQGAGTIYYS
ncbi:MAG: CotH kinase family protein, partial [Phycisphaeraceae bacterium]|nr:CotH kinase family protein [Phycisphaeraceae bacterium]